MAANRLTSIFNHLQAGGGPTESSNAMRGGGLKKVLEKNDDDIVITLAIRTPLTKGGRGGLKDTKLDKLLYSLFQSAIAKSNLDPALVEDICVGNVLNAQAANLGRGAALAAGFPNSTPLWTCNRFCSSGLLAVQSIANEIAQGSIDIGLAIGAESMTQDGGSSSPEFDDIVMANQEARDCLQPMLQTSENVAEEFNIDRERQDEFAAASYQYAEKAQKTGLFDEEIVPVKTSWQNPKTGETEDIVVTKDDGIRAGTTKELLTKLKPAAPQWGEGRSTAGNSSQITDGAACVLLMRRSTAKSLKQPILAKFVGAVAVALPPRIMGIGPSIAIPKILKKIGLTVDDVDLFEINEAFASMAVYCLEKLHIDREKVNVKGGAIAIGHPLGATGARQIATALPEMRRLGKKILCTSMCVGSGQGMASIISVEY